MQKVILVGNPNTGKTTLFNTMTRSSEHASNWHGVTVDVKEKEYKYKGQDFALCDLPGIYSFDSYSEEEKVASDFVYQNKDEIFICITDANNLKRNLYLFYDLKEISKDIVLVVNMANEVKNLDAKKLSDKLGVATVLVDARKKKSVEAVKEEVYKLFNGKENPIKQKILDAKQNTKIVKNFDINSFEAKSKQRFLSIEKTLSECNYNTGKLYGYSKMDKVLMHGFWSFVIFAIVMAAVFFITFGFVGSFFSGVIEFVFSKFTSLIMDFLSGFIKSEVTLRFIEEGVLGGALTVLTFMPQIILMFMCLNFLEDIGYLSRVAFMFDGLFKKLGLTGRSAFSLIMGFGCTTTAVMTTRNLDNKSLKTRTALLLPFSSCSAKLPIYAVICSAFFEKYKALIVFALYILGILIMTLIAVILKAFDKSKKEDSFMLEMPAYRFPCFSKIASGALSSAKSFFIRVGGVLTISSMVVFLLYNFSFKFTYVEGFGENSILSSLASSIGVIFKPLGFGLAGVVVAVLSGIVAKEMVVSSLAIVNGVTASSLALSLVNEASPAHFTTLSAISFLVFVLLYSPCISAIISMKKEVGMKCAITSVLLQFFVAYLFSFIVYTMGTFIINKIWWAFILCLIVVAILLVVVIKLAKKSKINISTSKCLDCKGSCHASCKAQGSNN